MRHHLEFELLALVGIYKNRTVMTDGGCFVILQLQQHTLQILRPRDHANG